MLGATWHPQGVTLVTQPPVRYENYPPDDSETPDETVPVVRPYVPDTIPPPPASVGTSRRAVVGLVIGLPVAGIILSAMAVNSSSTGRMGDMGGDLPADPSTEFTEEPDDPGSFGEDISVGSYTATAPSGWTVHDDGSGTVEVTNGANRLAAASFDTGTSTLAVEEIVHLAKTHRAGFSGKIADPVDRSSANHQHATMDGTGKFRGKAARLMSEVWIDDAGTGLLVVRILTAKAASVISTEAQEMLEQLSKDF
jgi:hypothetical protein